MIFNELFLKFANENRLKFLFYFIIIILVLPTESIILSRVYSILFDNVRTTGEKTVGKVALSLSLFTDQLKKKGPLYYISIIGGLWLVVFIGYMCRQVFESKIIPEYLQFVRSVIFKGLIEKYEGDYKDVKIGETITRLFELSRNMKDLMISIIGTLIPLFLGITILSGYILCCYPKIGIILIVSLFMLLLLGILLGKRAAKLSAERENAFIKLSENYSDTFGNLMNIYLNNTLNEEEKKQTKNEDTNKGCYSKQYITQKNLYLILCLIAMTTFMMVLIVSYSNLLNKKLNAIEFSSLIIMMLYYLDYLIRFANELPQMFLKYGVISNSRTFLNDILHYSTKAHKINTITNGKIELKKIYFKYSKTDDYILKDFSLTIDANKKVALLGKSGSGKTTIMKLILGMHKVSSGKILIDGTDITELKLSYLRKEVNYINQRTLLFNDTVINNMKYGNNKSNQDVVDILNKYNLMDLYSNLAKGINTNVGVNGSNLSLGMQKVTIILRGLLKGGKIVILDEPLAGLDSHTREKIMELINNLCMNKTVLIITHDPEVIPYMDSVYNMSELNEKQINES